MFLPSNRNPKINGSINPKINGSINPKINGSINPKINGSINPKINGSINPKINGSINPKINGSINPKINGSINPKINGSINPRLNTAINPNLNSAFSGNYIFNLDNELSAFIIKANDEIIIAFDFNIQMLFFGVMHAKGGFALFNNGNDYFGHFESDSQNGYNQFDENNNWISSIK